MCSRKVLDLLTEECVQAQARITELEDDVENERRIRNWTLRLLHGTQRQRDIARGELRRLRARGAGRGRRRD